MSRRRRRHSNTKGYRQIRVGATWKRASKLERELLKEKKDGVQAAS